MTNEAIKDFIGFTVLDATITGLVILIVCKFLLNPSKIGASISNKIVKEKHSTDKTEVKNG